MIKLLLRTLMCLALATSFVFTGSVATTGCAPYAWAPIAIAALDSAGEFISYVTDFFATAKQSSAAALIPDTWWPLYEDAMSRARHSLSLMRYAVAQGEAAEGDFWTHVDAFKKIGTELFELFKQIGFLQQQGPEAGTLRVPADVPLKAGELPATLPAPVNLQLPPSR